MDSVTPDEHHRSTILLVDDEPINLSVFGEFLTRYYQVLVATGGESALKLVNSPAKPDLILLDVMMPGMDGYQVLAELKARADTRDIPVIFVTALTSDLEEERGLALGAVDYIYKPCHLSILLARIRTQLELKKARDWLRNQNATLEAEVERRHKENQWVHMQLLQSEKLAAIGQLAAGIAHEINNPVGFVNSNLNTLSSYLADLFCILDAYSGALAAGAIAEPPRNELQTLLEKKQMAYLREDIPQLIAESREGLARVRAIVQDLKDFAHAGTDTLELSDLHKGLDSTLNIICNELKYHCKIVKEYGEIPQIYCLPSQLNQVFMNLLINAGQAIETQGVITVRTGCRENEIWVEIGDNGKGIAPEHISRLFEPFFTTKPVGKGTGLGLSISRNIVAKHGGRIEVESEPGQGSRFRVCLPIARPQPV
ncbi:response regulator [Methylomonas sp. SURF-1]|uniref:histidine kinase n=1 Tax=Methylomonas aurea TaxID=2952224 RepID=A0ABT1UH51_9GAMM|nr:ATP-binding protein [Methylomonas sp. SURF-1]MCQ8180756.1 response regulator [Methylomonas sp. SURF-1]